jgi:hypothetical protein
VRLVCCGLPFGCGIGAILWLLDIWNKSEQSKPKHYLFINFIQHSQESRLPTELLPAMPSTSSSKPRAILSEAQAIEIFWMKHTAKSSMQPCPSPVELALLFGVSEKAVRDIWKGRTWARATHFLDPTRPVLMKKQCGRPLGSKDSKPRIALRARNLSLLSSVRRTSIEQERFLESDIMAIDARTVICSSHPRPDGNISQQRNAASAFDSVDYQLHEWTNGTSTPSKLIDPFRLDWVDWVAAADCNKINL